MDALGALAAGCAVLLKPSERTPLTAELLRARLAGIGCAAGVRTGAGRPGGVRGRHRRRRLHPVHRFDGHGHEGDGTRRPATHAGQPGAGRQGPDDRAARTPTSIWPPTPRCGVACSTPARRACRSSGFTCSSRSTTQFVAAVVRAVNALDVGAGEGHHVGALIDESQVAVTERHVDEALANGRQGTDRR